MQPNSFEMYMRNRVPKARFGSLLRPALVHRPSATLIMVALVGSSSEGGSAAVSAAMSLMRYMGRQKI